MYLNQAFYYASSAVYANDVTAAVISGGGAESAPVSGGGGMRPGMFGGQTEDTPSTKAVKAGADMQISGGERSGMNGMGRRRQQ